MAIGGDGPWVIAVMWTLTAVTLVFVVPRVYTRVAVAESFGIDDHFYNSAFAFLVLYTVFISVAAHYGFGHDLVDIAAGNPNDLPLAILYEAIGQTFAIIGMAVAKWSVGLFLLRTVVVQWHKVITWITMGALMTTSMSTCFVFWLQCSPPKYLWDRRISGRCHIDSTPLSMFLSILYVVCDFLYAVLSWLFIWGLQMKKREKIVILISPSLGLVAGACGIKRTNEVPELASPNYTKDTIGHIVWPAAEIAVTMIYTGIAVCWALYKDTLRPGPTNRTLRSHGSVSGDAGSTLQVERGSCVETKAYAMGSRDESDEVILGSSSQRSQWDRPGASHGGITVTYEVTTSRQSV
ncbi:integral membrane pth11 [Fusarium albosuccineum]|uniref:Integral membrane pth11 n=1 Tax=Fusarium albosuccineum TaxID=1237068 RepID=A0A8H4LK70_9HYPO|nr:integral membrane pth11 [Fusarium albosuccineum]